MGNSRVLTVLAALLVVAIAPSSGSARAGGKTTQMLQLQTALLAQINSFRSAHGLVRLKASDPLTGVADRHSSQMAKLGFTLLTQIESEWGPLRVHALDR